MIEERLLSFWSLESGESGVGNAALLDKHQTAFFASRQCPGMAILAAMEWSIEQARSKNPVISGFHSPLEQSVLEVLLTAGAPCVMVIAHASPSGSLQQQVQQWKSDGRIVDYLS